MAGGVDLALKTAQVKTVQLARMPGAAFSASVSAAVAAESANDKCESEYAKCLMLRVLREKLTRTVWLPASR
jgi:hypothetical protein